MIDLTSKSIEDIEAVIKKYANILELFAPQTKPYVAYLVDVTVNHLKENYNNLSSDLKSLCVIVVKKNFDNINTDLDIKKIVDDFITYYNDNYSKYHENMFGASEWDLMYGFVDEYINKKIGR